MDGAHLFTDSSLLYSLSSALLPPGPGFDSLDHSELQWFNNLERARAFTAERYVSSSTSILSTSTPTLPPNLASELLRVLRTSSDPRVQQETLRLLGSPGRDVEGVFTQAVEFCQDLLVREDDAMDALFRLCAKRSPVDAMPVVAKLLRPAGTPSEGFLRYLNELERDISVAISKKVVSPVWVRYRDIVLTDRPLAYFPLSSMAEVENLGTMGKELGLNIIGDVSFGLASDGVHAGVFSPSSFVVAGFDDRLNPSPREPFTLELWVSLSISCDGGIVVSSFTNDETAPRGYRIECRRLFGEHREDIIEWTFRYAADVCTGSIGRLSTLGGGGEDVMGQLSSMPSPHRMEDEKRFKSSFAEVGTSFTHIVASYDGQKMCLFLNGTFAAFAQCENEIPRKNQDAPLCCGGGFGNERPHFYGRISDLAFFPICLDPTRISKHWSARAAEAGYAGISFSSTAIFSHLDVKPGHSSDAEDEDEAEMNDFSLVVPGVMDDVVARTIRVLSYFASKAPKQSSLDSESSRASATLSEILRELYANARKESSSPMSSPRRRRSEHVLVLCLKLIQKRQPSLATTELQSILIDLSQSSEYAVSDEAAKTISVYLMACASNPALVSGTFSFLSNLAAFLERRIADNKLPPPCVFSALEAAQIPYLLLNKENPVLKASYVASVLRCTSVQILQQITMQATDKASVEVSSLIKIAHSAVMAMLASGPEMKITKECTEAGLNLLLLLARDAGSQSLSPRNATVNSSLDVEWTLVDFICSYTFRRNRLSEQATVLIPEEMESITPKSFIERHKAILRASNGGGGDVSFLLSSSELLDLAMKRVSIPLVQTARFRGKPAESFVLDALAATYSALLACCPAGGDNSFSDQAWRISWGILTFLNVTHQKSQTEYPILSARVLQATELLKSRRLGTSSLENNTEPPVRESVPQDDIDDASENEKGETLEELACRSVLRFITEFVSNFDDAFVESVMMHLDENDENLYRLIDGADSIAQIIRRASPAARLRLVYFFAERTVVEGAFSTSSQVSLEEMRDKIGECLCAIMDSSQDTDDEWFGFFAVHAIEKFLPIFVEKYATTRQAFDRTQILFEKFIAGAARSSLPPLHQRFANDALDSIQTPFLNPMPLQQLVSSNAMDCSVAVDSNGGSSLIQNTHRIAVARGTHGLLSGKFYFEFACESKGDSVLLHVGLCSSKKSNHFDGGCRTLIGNGLGIGILVDLDAGGMFSVYSIPEDDILASGNRAQRIVRLGALKYQCAVPAKRPLFPIVASLSLGKRVRVAFAENASRQVVQHMQILNTPVSLDSNDSESDQATLRDVIATATISRPETEARFAGPLAWKFDNGRTELFGCGQNAFCELGVGSDNQKPKRRLSEAKETKDLFPCQIAAGNEFSGLVTSEGLVYTWGLNVKGSCGQGLPVGIPGSNPPPSHIPVPSLVRALRRIVVTRLCAQNGCENMFAVTSEGEAFAWGLNKHGQCGLGTVEETIYSPTRVTFPIKDRVAFVANSYSHTLFLFDGGAVLSCGLNSKGQLGLGGVGDIRPFPHRVAPDLWGADVKNPRATCVAVGALHSLVVDETGAAYAFGKNDYGQLGLGRNVAFSDLPRLVPMQSKSQINIACDKVSCGYHFSLLLSKDGRLFAFGKNDSGQLGLGHAREIFTPEQVKLDSNTVTVAALSCGTGHWIAVSCDGRAFACGRNKFGGVGDGSTSDRLIPIELAFSGSGSVVGVACGFHHTLVLCGQVDERMFFVPDTMTNMDYGVNEIIGFDSNEMLPRRAQWLQFLRSSLELASVESAIGKKTVLAWLESELKTLPVESNRISELLNLAIDAKLDMPTKRETFELGRKFLSSSNSLIVTMGLEWLCASIVRNGFVPSDEFVFDLLKLAGHRCDAIVASEAVFMLRTLLSRSALDTSTFLKRYLNHRESASRLDTLLGAIAVMGGDLEVVRSRGRARLVAGQIDRGHSGVVVWYRPTSHIAAQLKLDDSNEFMFARKATDLIPLPKSNPPKVSTLDGEFTIQELATLARFHADLAVRAFSCKAMGALLKNQPELVSAFVAHGQLSFVSSFFNVSLRGRGIHELERRYSRLMLNSPPGNGSEFKTSLSTIDFHTLPRAAVSNESLLESAAKGDFDSFDVDALRVLNPHCGRLFVDPVDLETGTRVVVSSTRDGDLFDCARFGADGLMLTSACLAQSPAEHSLLIDVCFMTGSPSDVTISLTGDFWSCSLLPPRGIVRSSSLVNSLGSSSQQSNSASPTLLFSVPSNQFIRIVFVESLTQRRVFVNGAKCFSGVPGVPKNSDSRHMFRNEIDKNVKDQACFVLVSAAQVRAYALSDDEIRVFGKPSARGIPLPMLFDLANGLRDQLELPLAWCVKALDLCAGGTYRSARELLLKKESALIRSGRGRARILVSLGFDSSSCAVAVASTTTLFEAVGFLIGEHRQSDFASDKSFVKALSKISPLGSGGVLSSSNGPLSSSSGKTAILNAVNLLDDGFIKSSAVLGDEWGGIKQQNQTFEMASTSRLSAFSSRGGIMAGGGLAPSAASFMQADASSTDSFESTGVVDQCNAVDQTLFEILAAHARRATVFVLDADPRNALLGSTKHYFIRDYLRAFPDSLVDRDDANNGNSFSRDGLGSLHVVGGEELEDDENPVRIMKRCLAGVVTSEINEVESSSTKAKNDIDVDFNRWWSNPSLESRAKTLEKDDMIWFRNNVGEKNKAEAFSEEFRIFSGQVVSIHRESEEVSVSSLMADAPIRLNIDQIRLTPPPRIVNKKFIVSERRRAVEEVEVSHWNTSVCKSLLEILLGELARLASSVQRTLSTGLQIGPAHVFRAIASSSHANQEISIWRPTSVVPGFYSLGDVAEPNAQAPAGIVYMVSDSDGAGGKCVTPGGDPLLLPPLSFELIWTLEDASPKKTNFWRPVPSPGYASLGVVVTCSEGSSIPPSKDVVRCVHLSCTQPSNLGAGVWSKEDVVQVWRVMNEFRTFIVKRAVSPTPAQFVEQAFGSTSLSQREVDEDDVLLSDNDMEAHREAARHQSLEAMKYEAQKSILALKLSSSSYSSVISAQLAFWIFFLLVELTPHIERVESWRRRIFGPPTLYVLVRLANDNPLNGVRALRALSSVLAHRVDDRSGLRAISASQNLREEFLSLQKKLENLLAHECAESHDPEMALYSSNLCALVELFVSVMSNPNNAIEDEEQVARFADDDFSDLPNTVRELSLIMDVLGENNSKSRFPDDFFMAEDTFLKLARADDTTVVESAHPYSMNGPLLEGVVFVEKAESLILRFDRRSATSFGHGLSIEQESNGRDDALEEMLQGNFGGSVVYVPVNSFQYRFPVDQVMNWCLSPISKGPNIKLSNAGMTACMRKDRTWESVLATKGFSRGINSWEVRVDRCTSSSNIFFGIVARNTSCDNYVGCDEIGWGWIGCMACWHGGRRLKHPFGQRLKTGDVVRVTYDAHRRALCIALNGVDQGIALDRLPLATSLDGGKFYPAFSFYNRHDQFTLLRGGVAS